MGVVGMDMIADELDRVVGKLIWLEYCDQNYKFEKAFAPQYCKVLRRFTGVGGAKDWYLVALETSVDYDGQDYSYLMIRPRWVGGKIGGDDPTAVFIVLVPDPNELTDPFEMNRSLYVAWGFTAQNAEQIKHG